MSIKIIRLECPEPLDEATGEKLFPSSESMGRTLLKRQVTYENIRHVLRSMIEEVKGCFGDDLLADVATNPPWWGELNAARELVACRADRRR